MAQNSATHMTIEQVYRRDRYLRGGDQISFLENGYPAVRFTEPIENFDHEHQNVRKVHGVQFGTCRSSWTSASTTGCPRSTR
ncbi:MAG: hypothetical protein ACRDPM_19055 [Solirubrobacteraceae bacterium]